jgi:hypothetical protein
MVGRSFCTDCGAETNALAEVCVKCGVRLPQAQLTASNKSKTVAVLLAVFLGFFTWLYTYRTDSWKFWLALGVFIANFVLIIITLGIWVLVSWAVAVGLWVWAIIDVAMKPNEWYERY